MPLRKLFSMILSILLVAGMLSGCFATATTRSEPPAGQREGIAPTAALLPIENTNDPELADFVAEHLVDCLETRNVFRFADQEKVALQVKTAGVDLQRTFGLSDAQYRQLAAALKVDYVIDGIVTVRKTLSLAGWRKDVDLYMHIHRATDGKKIDSWRSMTDFTFTSTETALDAEKMAQSAANHLCAKMLEARF